MSKEEILKLHSELNPEALAKKMSGVMMIVARSDPKDKGSKEFLHVMENFTPSEMAYIVCAHAAITVKTAIEQVPAVGKMLNVLKEFDDIDDIIKDCIK